MRILLNTIAATSALFASVVFLRFWRDTFDRLFLCFAIAFGMFMLNYALLALMNISDETRVYVYLPRLAGFILILYAIVDRNQRR